MMNEANYAKDQKWITEQLREFQKFQLYVRQELQVLPGIRTAVAEIKRRLENGLCGKVIKHEAQIETLSKLPDQFQTMQANLVQKMGELEVAIKTQAGEVGGIEKNRANTRRDIGLLIAFGGVIISILIGSGVIG